MKQIILIFLMVLVHSFELFAQPYVTTRINSTASGTGSIVVQVEKPVYQRYSEGAPICVIVPGGWNAQGISNNPFGILSKGFIEISFNFPGGGIPPNNSHGFFDTRGHLCVQALRDVIKFATGVITDTAGRTLAQIVSPFTPLYSNTGLIGLSNGGNLTLTTAGSYGQSIQNIKWIVNWESPVGDAMPGAEAGSYGVPFYNNPLRNPAYNDTTGLFDYTKLKYSDTLKATAGGGNLFSGSFYFDINNNNKPDTGTDFMVKAISYDSNSIVKTYWSLGLIQNAYLMGIVPTSPPSHIPTVTQTQNFWRWRNGEYWIDSAINKLQNLMFIAIGSQEDHVQSALNYPHILKQYELVRLSGCRFVRLNPDRIYVEYAGGTAYPEAKDNNAFQLYNNLTIRTAVEPETVFNSHLQAGAVCELSDRTYYNNLIPNLNGILIDIKKNSEILPGKFFLYQNYPNPFNPVTKIKFQIPLDVKRKTLDVKLIVYDILGKEITTLVNNRLRPGTYEVQWDGSNYSSGIYYYKLQAGDFTETRKMILLK